MKKSKTKTQTNKRRTHQNRQSTAKAAKPQPAAETTLVPTDIRKAYKNRLINAYFSRPH